MSHGLLSAQGRRGRGPGVVEPGLPGPGSEFAARVRGAGGPGSAGGWAGGEVSPGPSKGFSNEIVRRRGLPLYPGRAEAEAKAHDSCAVADQSSVL